jgi:hypothetical protein
MNIFDELKSQFVSPLRRLAVIADTEKVWSDAAREAAAEARQAARIKGGDSAPSKIGGGRGASAGNDKVLTENNWSRITDDETGATVYNHNDSDSDRSDWIRSDGANWEHREDPGAGSRGYVLASGKGSASLSNYLSSYEPNESPRVK